ncbi:hypothetical protein CBS147343_1923 [Aspergillus niger]|uniref:Contig An01c0300, genomic contig n=3 Tax=Aspergillus niger TaxID=5061 RepID=A2Q9T4_ASPNC|nr:uncharacterized protein An01g09020 [Aspergillus niger]RDH17809.1 hypothetical protein M747DRAFT_297768 [Aspergillus niger ATCC 13496]KAI2856674.1 hypothetical protein CBS11232_3687 [Aspergillus niger]KAI2881396.1 hypothetical protein CBS115988_724 [Aspergillus niger]KAI2961532.1 hypothetical protein CBS147322_170 [Aspergillus niger]KAI3000414.1 hypothetical protein CBS147482_7039 [Aspergillus niger]
MTSDKDIDPLDLPICTTCGTQFSTPTPPTPCPICDDPRQYLPPSGQDYTTLRALRAPTHEPPLKNILAPLSNNNTNTKIYTLHTTPKHCIGQRAFLLLTPHGNILWDCIPYLDDDTITQIKALGGISAIIISHPHYYATHLVWAEVFNCPVYLSVEDREWVMRLSPQDSSVQGGGGSGGKQIFWEGKEVEVLPGSGVIGVKTGGHFPGSSVLWWKDEGVMFLADTIGTIPSGVGDYGSRGRREGTASYTFMWSYPNMIPLPPDEVHGIWKAIKHTEFDRAYGAFMGMDTVGNCKKRVLDSAKIFVRAMGYLDHAIHEEDCA